MNIIFRECPNCHGYGVLDSGKYCTLCGGKGKSGKGTIGSGEIMIDKDTGRQITVKEFIKLHPLSMTK